MVLKSCIMDLVARFPVDFALEINGGSGIWDGNADLQNHPPRAMQNHYRGIAITRAILPCPVTAFTI